MSAHPPGGARTGAPAREAIAAIEVALPGEEWAERIATLRAFINGCSHVPALVQALRELVMECQCSLTPARTKARTLLASPALAPFVSGKED